MPVRLAAALRVVYGMADGLPAHACTSFHGRCRRDDAARAVRPGNPPSREGGRRRICLHRRHRRGLRSESRFRRQQRLHRRHVGRRRHRHRHLLSARPSRTRRHCARHCQACRTGHHHARRAGIHFRQCRLLRAWHPDPCSPGDDEADEGALRPLPGEPQAGPARRTRRNPSRPANSRDRLHHDHRNRWPPPGTGLPGLGQHTGGPGCARPGVRRPVRAA